MQDEEKADNMAEEGERAAGNSEEVKPPRRRFVFPKSTRSTAI